MNYYYTKPENLEPDKQLFSEDKDGGAHKKYFFKDHKEIYSMILKRIKLKQRCNYYEDHTYNKLIKLHVDIDYIPEKVYEHEVYKKRDADKIILDVIEEINNKINKSLDSISKKNLSNIKSIVWMSNGLNKLSLHIIFPEIYFRSIYEMGFFCSDIKYVDMKIYRVGCFRLPLCCKYGKNNRLIYYSSYNYLDNCSKTYKEIFLDSCITNENTDIKEIITCDKPIINFIKVRSTSSDYYYTGYDINMYLRDLEEMLQKIEMSEYDVWLNVTSSVKDLYINLNGNQEDKEKIYEVYDRICSIQPKYIKIENRKIFDNLDSFIDINYLYFLSKTDGYIMKIYKIKEMMFNPEKYEDRIIMSYENYIDLDLDEIVKYDTHFWKSPPGTGKTFVMKKLIHKLNIKSILSITSRVNLAGEHMGDLELEFYKKANLKKCKKLAIQLESLYKCRLDNFTDGILILDEINSLLTHLRSPTVANKRSLNFVCLIELIKSAKYVICLDADICDWNIEFINKIRKNKTNNIPIDFGFASDGELESDNIINQKIDNKPSEYLVYYNVFPNKLDVPATIYECEYRMIYEMVKLAKENTVFVSCFDSLSYMECVIKYLSDYIPKEKMLIYSSKIDYGIINTEDWKDKYVFYSPSIIYGISYDKIPTEVFCFIKKTHLNALIIYQMMNRVRMTKKLNLYCILKCEYNKYKSLDHVKADYELFANKLMENTRLKIDLTEEEKELYQLMYFNHIYLDSALKTNTYYYLFNILYSLGFKITKNIDKTPKLYLKKDQIISEKIHEDILDIFNVKEIELSEFEHSVLESKSALEKHFNLRSYCKSTIDKKMEDYIMKAMFTESLKNRYIKINLFEQLLKELGFENIEMLKYKKQKSTLCEDCKKSINNPVDISNNKCKIRWCNKLIDKLDDNDISNNIIYTNIKKGKVVICPECKYLIKKNIIITDMLGDMDPSILDKFNDKVDSEWIKNNLDYILKIFDIRCDLSVNYYNLYLLMITMFKNLFDSSLLEKNRLLHKNNRYYIYNLNTEMFDNHKKLMDLLDKNNFQKNYRISFSKYCFDDEIDE